MTYSISEISIAAFAGFILGILVLSGICTYITHYDSAEEYKRRKQEEKEYEDEILRLRLLNIEDMCTKLTDKFIVGIKNDNT